MVQLVPLAQFHLVLQLGQADLLGHLDQEDLCPLLVQVGLKDPVALVTQVNQLDQQNQHHL